MPVLFLILYLLSLPQSGHAEQAQELPVSPSYHSIQKCFKGFDAPRLRQKLELEELKKVLDKKIATLRSEVKERVVSYRDLKGEVYRLKDFMTGYDKLGKVQRGLTLERVNNEGLGEPVSLPRKDVVNPTAQTISKYLGNQTVQEDRIITFDYKSNSLRATTVRNLQGIEKYKIESLKKKWSLDCSKQDGQLVICLCSKN
ncbi:MAG: hypothetical protein ACLGGX_04125 [Bdellovibrionia bacterium]